MNKLRPETTLFLLISVDGKISTGDTDKMDVDKDYPRIKGIKEGLYQYYDLEQQTDLYSLNSGRVLSKIGVNEKTDKPDKLPVSFVVIDNEPYLNEKGISYMVQKSKTLYIITTNSRHPGLDLKKDHDNLEVVLYENDIDFSDMMRKLKQDYKVDRMTIQTGGTLNTLFVREGLVDHVSIVIAPALIGGKNTSTLMDNESLHNKSELFKIKALKLKKCEQLKNSYLHLMYDVINQTIVEP